MSVKQFYIKTSAPASSSNFGSLADGVDQAGHVTIPIVSGWSTTSSNLVNQYFTLLFGMINNTVYSSSPKPDAPPNNDAGLMETGISHGDGFRSESPLSGTFASGDWALNCNVQTQSDGPATLSLYTRLWKSANADGSSAIEITSGAIASDTHLFDITTFQYPFQTTYSIGSPITLSEEYLFIQVAILVNGISQAFIVDGNSSDGSSILTTPDFVDTPPVPADKSIQYTVLSTKSIDKVGKYNLTILNSRSVTSSYRALATTNHNNSAQYSSLKLRTFDKNSTYDVYFADASGLSKTASYSIGKFKLSIGNSSSYTGTMATSEFILAPVGSIDSPIKGPYSLYFPFRGSVYTLPPRIERELRGNRLSYTLVVDNTTVLTKFKYVQDFR